MGSLFTKAIDSHFFKSWSPETSYVLGYITADGCIVVDKRRKKNPFALNITSAEKDHLHRIRKALSSTHKISEKSGGYSDTAYQLQFRNPVICEDLIKLGILPRKTYNLNPIKVPEKYFSDFVRGFFDGDGTVYIYKVNGTPQIKASFVNPSSIFTGDLNRRLCKNLNIPRKNIHQETKRKSILYSFCFYIDDCEKLGRFMYRNNPSLYLPRKYKIFEKWKTIKRRKYIKHDYPSKVGWQINQNLIT